MDIKRITEMALLHSFIIYNVIVEKWLLPKPIVYCMNRPHSVFGIYLITYKTFSKQRDK